MHEPGIVSIVTTYPSRESAEDLGRRLVEARLAACVQVDGPLTSVFHWQGRVETQAEWRCTCKTTADRREACIAAIVAGHEYETPQVVASGIDCEPAYAAWVRRSVSPT